MKTIRVPVSIGEVADKITILTIKQTKLTDPEKAQIAADEQLILLEALEEWEVDISDEEMNPLLAVNKELWEVEDQMRDLLDGAIRNSGNAPDMIWSLSDKIQDLNHSRFLAKDAINLAHGSSIREVKHYGTQAADVSA